MMPHPRGDPEQEGRDDGERASPGNRPVIPRYDLREEVGSGGMSVVYRATDRNLGREVAVKILHRHLAGRQEERGRFRREAQAVARLCHPNVLEVHDYSGHDVDEAYIVSEFIRGPTLRRFADEVGFGLPEIGALVAERIASALAHAHDAGIIHRDVKPENVMLQDDGTVKLTDFGIARMVDRDDRMTQTGALLGSPAHMPPEIVAGEKIDHRADIFSLGTVLYWLTGAAMPFTGESPAQVLRKIVESDYEDPRAVDPRISDQLAAIICKAMARRPDDRHASAAELQSELAAYLTDLGFGRSQDEISEFFAEPTAFKKKHRDRLLALLLDRGNEAAARGDTAAAISAMDRVLALRPGHQEALAALEKLRRRTLPLALVGAAAGALLLAVVLVVSIGPWDRPADPTTPAEPTDSSEPSNHDADAAQDAQGTGPALAATDEAAARSPGVSRVRSTSSGATRAPAGTPSATDTGRRAGAGHSDAFPSTEPSVVDADPKPRSVRILLDTWADISIDGETIERDREAWTDLEAGTYTLAVTREGFVPVEETLDVSPGEEVLEVRHRLVPQPATIRIINDQNAAVSLNGKLIGPATAGGFEIPVTFPELPDGRFEYPLGTILRIEKPGYREQEHQVHLRPGQTEEILVELEPET